VALVVLVEFVAGFWEQSKKFVLLRSPFVHKKTQEPFEISNPKLIIQLKSKHTLILNLVINYISKCISIFAH
jgi:ribosomal protein S10